MNNGMERRDFIKRSIATVGAAAAASADILGANDRIRVGVIGPGRQGRGVMKTFMKNPDAQVVALRDVFQPQMDFAILCGTPKRKRSKATTPRRSICRVNIASHGN